jgi:general secretion pathway protein A
MYEAFYGLNERPFELLPNLRFLYLPEPHREALGNLTYGLSSRKSVTVLTGEAGTGKTTLIAAAVDQAATILSCVHLANSKLTRAEFFQFLAHAYNVGDGAGESKTACMIALEKCLVARMNRGCYHTLIVDEAQTVAEDVLEEIRLLTNLEASGGKLLSIVLVGQPEFGERLDTPSLRHLKQRVALRCQLRTLTLQETAGYMASRIKVAGGVAAALFTREAVEAIHAMSGGIPRVISVVADNALITGFAVNEKPVSSRLVAEVCRDFHLGATVPTGQRPELEPHARVAPEDHQTRSAESDTGRSGVLPASGAQPRPLFASFGRRRGLVEPVGRRS